MDLEVAISCAESLSLAASSPSPRNVRSALTAIITTARYVENAVQGDPNLGILQLSIVAKTKSGEKHQLFTLWGPEFQNSVSPQNILGDSRGTRAEPQKNLEI